MRIDLDEWAKEYAKRKNKRKSSVAKLRGLYKGRMYISKDAFDYRIIPLNELNKKRRKNLRLYLYTVFIILHSSFPAPYK